MADTEFMFCYRRSCFHTSQVNNRNIYLYIYTLYKTFMRTNLQSNIVPFE